MNKPTILGLLAGVSLLAPVHGATTAFTPSTITGTTPAASIDGAGLITLTQAVNGQYNHIGFNVSDPGVKTGISFNFGVRIATGGAGTADGFSIGVGNTANIGGSGASPELGEEGNFAGGLAFSFDTWNNAGPDPGPDSGDLSQISLHWNGTKITSVDDTRLLAGGFAIDDGVARTASGFADLSAGTVSLTFGGVPIFTNVAVPGLVPMESRVVISGRTGGENQLVEVSDLNVAFVPEPMSAVLVGLGGIGLVLRRRRR